MAQLFPMNLVNPVLYMVEQVQSASRDSGQHVAPVLAATFPHDQLRGFEAIEKTGDIRNLPHQAFGDFTAAKTGRFRPAQNPKNVVLRRRDAVWFQSSLERVLQQGRGALDAQVGLFFQAFEGTCLFQFCL